MSENITFLQLRWWVVTISQKVNLVLCEIELYNFDLWIVLIDSVNYNFLIVVCPSLLVKDGTTLFCYTVHLPEANENNYMMI